jgi:hypothetical protein
MNATANFAIVTGHRGRVAALRRSAAAPRVPSCCSNTSWGRSTTGIQRRHRSVAILAPERDSAEPNSASSVFQCRSAAAAS